MSLTLAIFSIAVFDVLLLAGLAFVMSLPRKLTPHGAAIGRLAVEPAEPAIRIATAPTQRMPVLTHVSA